MAFEVGERAFLLGEDFKTHHTLYKHKCVYLAGASLFSSLEFWLIVNDVCVLTRGFFFYFWFLFSNLNYLNSSSVML